MQTAFNLADIFVALPEVVLALAALLWLVVGVFLGDKRSELVTMLVIATLALVGGWIWHYAPQTTYAAFGGLFLTSPFTIAMKVLVLAGAVLVLIMTLPMIRQAKGDYRFEFPILVMLAVLGMLLMISANDLLSLYMGLELSGLSLYVLAAFNRDDSRATEAGMKYFVLGALASGLILYGTTLIYGFSGTTSFAALAKLLQDPFAAQGTGIIVGLVLVIAGMCFKVSAVPFHMWTPDVYEGAPTQVTAFFAIAPKVAATALFVRLLMEPFAPLFSAWQQIIIFVSVASMMLGAFAAMRQQNIKRLLAYSSIGHIGYALTALAAGTQEGVAAIIVYLALYLVMSAGAFACVLLMRRNGVPVEQVSDLSGLARTHPRMAAAMAIFMFSMAGIPPLAGFFGKMAVFLAVIEAGLIWLAVAGVLASVVGAYYYLRIVKRMYMDEPEMILDKHIPFEMRLVLAATTAIMLLFAFYPTPLFQWASVAAESVGL